MSNDSKKQAKDDTRLVRLDAEVSVKVQIEVDAKATPDQAKAQALVALNAALKRLREDSKISATSTEKAFLDPRGHRAATKGQ